MEDLESKLNQLLSSPEDMAKIMNLAKSLSGGDGAASPPKAEEAETDEYDPLPDSKLLELVSRLFREYQTTGKEKAALAQSLSPYLEPDRREKLQKAVKIARLLQLAKAFLKDSGGDFHL